MDGGARPVSHARPMARPFELLLVGIVFLHQGLFVSPLPRDRQQLEIPAHQPRTARSEGSQGGPGIDGSVSARRLGKLKMNRATPTSEWMKSMNQTAMIDRRQAAETVQHPQALLELAHGEARQSLLTVHGILE